VDGPLLNALITLLKRLGLEYEFGKVMSFPAKKEAEG